MLYHSFALNVVESTIGETWHHIEELIEEYQQDGETRFWLSSFDVSISMY